MWPIGVGKTVCVTSLPAIRRDPVQGQLAGVCAALAAQWRVDPSIVRIGFAIVAVATQGVALAAYLIGWALIPRVGSNTEPVRELMPFTRTWSRAQLMWVVIAVCVGGIAATGAGPGALAVFAVLWLVLRTGRGRRGASPAPSAPVPAPFVPRTEFERRAVSWQERLQNVDAGRPADWTPPLPTAPAPPLDARVTAPAVNKRRGRRTWLAIAVWLGVLWLTGRLVTLVFGVPIPAIGWAAGVTAVLALALLVVARPERSGYGRPPGLMTLTILASFATAALLVPAHVPDLPDVPRGVHTLVGADLVAQSAQELPLGEQTVDLTGAAVTESRTVTFTQDAGSVTVLVPPSGNVVVNAKVDLGSIETPTTTIGGLDLESTWTRTDAPGEPVLTIDVQVDVGKVEVRP